MYPTKGTIKVKQESRRGRLRLFLILGSLTAVGPIAIDVEGLVRTIFATAGYGEEWYPAPAQLRIELDLCRCPLNDGEAEFRTVADESELLLIAVAPSRHRRGIGRMLLDDFLDRVRNDGVSRVHLEVREGNSAVSLYREAGFSPVGRRRNYYHASDGRRFDAVTLSHEL